MAKFRIEKQYLSGIMCWIPCDEYSQEITKQAPIGKVMECDHKFPRNPGNHRRFFAFLNIAFDAQDHFDNIHHFRKWLIMKSGHYKIIKAPNGYEIFDADSISWDKMDEPEFKDTINDCIQAFISAFGDRLPDNLLDQIVRF